MTDDIDRALAPLVGLPVWGPARASNMLALQFGARRPAPARDEPTRQVGEYALHVFCAWRLTRAETVLAASGDLFTPADPDEELDTFDFDVPGATWWDVRVAAYFGAAADGVNGADGPSSRTVTAARGDALGGARLTLSDGVALELFPNSSPAEHFETEFWRLRHPNVDVVVGTFGVDRERPDEA